MSAWVLGTFVAIAFIFFLWITKGSRVTRLVSLAAAAMIAWAGLAIWSLQHPRYFHGDLAVIVDFFAYLGLRLAVLCIAIGATIPFLIKSYSARALCALAVLSATFPALSWLTSAGEHARNVNTSLSLVCSVSLFEVAIYVLLRALLWPDQVPARRREIGEHEEAR